MSDWVRIGATADIPLLEGRAVAVGDRRVAIFRLPGWAAVDATCTTAVARCRMASSPTAA